MLLNKLSYYNYAAKYNRLRQENNNNKNNNNYYYYY